MRKRRVYLILGVVAVVLAGILVAVFSRSREREPEYGGKRLSEWVESYWYQENGTREADTAIRHIGTNAIPYLLNWMRYETPAWRTKLQRSVNTLFKSMQPTGVMEDEKNHRADGTPLAFRALGPATKEAIPELVQLLKDRNSADVSTMRAADALANLGSAGIPALVVGLTNHQAKLRAYVVFRIGMMRSNALPAVTALLNLLRDSDFDVRQMTTNALRKIDPEALEKGGHAK